MNRRSTNKGYAYSGGSQRKTLVYVHDLHAVNLC